MSNSDHVNDGSGGGKSAKDVIKDTIRQAKNGTKNFMGDVKDVACELFPGMKSCGGAGDLVSDKPLPQGETYVAPEVVSFVHAKAASGNDDVVTGRSSIGSSDSGMSLDDSGISSGGKSSSSGSVESSSFGSGSGQFIWMLLILACLIGLCGGIAYAFQKGMFGKKKKKRTLTAKPPIEVTPTPPPQQPVVEEPPGTHVEVSQGTPVYLEKIQVDGGVGAPVMLQAAPPVVVDDGAAGYPMGYPGMAQMFTGSAGYMPTPQTDFVQPMQQFNSEVGQLQVPQIFPTSAYATAAPATAATAFAVPTSGVPTVDYGAPSGSYQQPGGMPSVGFIPAPPFPTTAPSASAVSINSGPYTGVPTVPSGMPAGLSVQAMAAPTYPYQYSPAGI